MASIAQAFLINRIYLLSGRKRVVPTLLLAVTVVQCAFSFALTVEIFKFNREFQKFDLFAYVHVLSCHNPGMNMS